MNEIINEVPLLSVKYDTTKTIMSKDAHNIEENSMLESAVGT